MYDRETVGKLAGKGQEIMIILKKIAKLIFNRLFYVVLAMAVQLGWLLLLFLKAASYSRYISVGLTILSILVVLWIVNREINPSYKLAWAMLILSLPIFGLVLYLVFGQSRIARTMQMQFNEMLVQTSDYLKDDSETRKKLEVADRSACIQSDYIFRSSDIRYMRILQLSIFRWVTICFLYLSKN